jgi:tRNA-modifying protein YgfZ
VAEGREVGRLYTQSGGLGLAWLRLDQATGGMESGPARVQRI